MVAAAAAKLMSASMLEELQKKVPGASAQPFQDELSLAVCMGVIKAMKNMAKGIGAAGSPAAGAGTGITGLSPERMSAAGLEIFEQKVGSVGPAAAPMMKATFEGIVKLLGTATVSSISGFGGSIFSIVNLDEKVVAQMIFEALPPQTQEGMSKSKFGKVMIEAIARGFCKEIKTGSATIPTGGGTPGPTLAAFS